MRYGREAIEEGLGGLGSCFVHLICDTVSPYEEKYQQISIAKYSFRNTHEISLSYECKETY